MKKREPNPHLVRLIVWSKAKRKVLGLSIDFSSSAQEHESLGSMAIAPGNVFQRRIPVRKKTPKTSVGHSETAIQQHAGMREMQIGKSERFLIRCLHRCIETELPALVKLCQMIILLNLCQLEPVRTAPRMLISYPN